MFYSVWITTPSEKTKKHKMFGLLGGKLQNSQKQEQSTRQLICVIDIAKRYNHLQEWVNYYSFYTRSAITVQGSNIDGLGPKGIRVFMQGQNKSCDSQEKQLVLSRLYTTNELEDEILPVYHLTALIARILTKLLILPRLVFLCLLLILSNESCS